MFDPSAMMGGSSIPSINGGDSGPALSGSDLTSRQDTGGLFSPFYFGGSGGGATGFLAVLALVVMILWNFKSR